MRKYPTIFKCAHCGHRVVLFSEDRLEQAKGLFGLKCCTGCGTPTPYGSGNWLFECEDRPWPIPGESVEATVIGDDKNALYQRIIGVPLG